MIAFLTLAYAAVLFVLVKLKVLPNKPGTWLSIIGWIVVLFIFLFIPLQWGAPSGPVRLMTRAVQIVPNVSGTVVEIAARPNGYLKKDDLLFRIDPEPFQFAVDLAEATLVRTETQIEQDRDSLAKSEAEVRRTEAQQQLAQQRFDDDEKLVASGTIAQNRLERRQADLDSAIAAVDQAAAAVSAAKAELGAIMPDGEYAKIAEARSQLDQARWNLEQADVRAPSDGFMTNLALTLGQRVTNLPLAPAGLFVDTSERIYITEINQIHLRHVRPGQPIEIALKTAPGQIVTGEVELIIDLASQGQAIVSGTLPQAGAVHAEPFFVRLRLDDVPNEELLKPGAVGTAAIYTESVAPTHIIRKVMIRMEAILNYLNPAL